MAARDKYKFVGVTPDELTGGRPLAPGDVVDKVDEKDPHNRRLIEGGKLVQMVRPQAKPAVPAASTAGSQDDQKEDEG